jgi:ribosome maturation factor RimP
MGCGPFFVCAMNRNQYEWVERAVTGLGYEFVHLEWVPRSGLMRVYIDKEGGVNVDDCARVSDHLSRSMTVEGIAYDRLEVSSPGLDRPLARERDFKRFAGHKARVVLRVPVNGRKTITGAIGESKNGSIALAADGNVVFVIDLANIDKARLVPEL